MAQNCTIHYKFQYQLSKMVGADIILPKNLAFSEECKEVRIRNKIVTILTIMDLFAGFSFL